MQAELYSNEAEISVLGGMLIDNAAINTAARTVQASSFAQEPHRVLFAAMLRLHYRSVAVDPVTLSEELGPDRLRDAGGMEYIAELLDVVPTAANIVFHARIVAEHALRREMIRLAHSGDMDALSAAFSTFSERTSAGLSLLTDIELERLPAPDWLWENFVPATALAVIFGPPGAGKSFVALALAMSIGSGFQMLGATVRRGAVVYIAPEGVAGIPARVRAWKDHHGYHGPANVYFVPAVVSMLDDRAVKELIRTIQPIAPVAIFIDTLARSLPGGDENSASDMGTAITNADRIRTELGAAVILVHHTNASGERERGSTALRGAADTMIQVQATDGSITLTCEKQKDAAPFSRMELALLPVAESAVVTPVSGWELRRDELTPNKAKVLRLLSETFGSEGATATQWEKVCTEAKVASSSFYRSRTFLCENGFVQPRQTDRGGRYTLTEKGIAAHPPTLPSHSHVTPSRPTPSLPPNGGLLETPEGGSNGHEREDAA